ncbi:NUDIX domain-containing protein [Desulforhopalus singaporensis]|uniref:Uncharacterized protein n=1 Tax=Desulforhopalus singaporensis TaxID=91360 RepID=A0A1H0SP85_9BACT|nr:NUDIX domain-containing protein [Desulforhopalus singaporensis]SDP43473.1 hypothetical protein SAMN05660330_02751 [Desulforhopalus singaporensis]
MENFWKASLSICGFSAVAAFVFWSLYKNWLSLPIFSRLNQNYTFILMLVFLILTFAALSLMLITYLKVNSTKEQENNSIVNQSAAFCYRKNPELKVMLVRTSGRRWTFPKGTNVEGQSNYSTARINALEEAGVKGFIQKKPFSNYKHYKQELKNDGKDCLNEIFFLKVDEVVACNEAHRKPTWFTFDEAEIALREGRDAFYAKEFSRVINEAKIILST